MKKRDRLDFFDVIVLLSCLAGIVIALTLTVMPHGPLTQVTLLDYPTTMSHDQPLNFSLNITGQSHYSIDIFEDNEKLFTVLSNGSTILHFGFSNITKGLHRFTAQVNDLVAHDYHSVFFTVDVV